MYNINKGILYSYIDIYNNILLCKFYKNIYNKWGGAVQNDGAGAARSSSQTQLKIYRLAVANRSQLALTL